MALYMNNAHIIYHDMDAAWLMGLVQSYISKPDCLVIQYWVCTTILFPESVPFGGPQVHCFIKFFLDGLSYTLEGVHCHHIVAIIDAADIV